MIVVADTGPLNYLIQINCDNLLPQLYQRVLVPAAVIQELDDPGAPGSVRSWLAQQPSWLEICLNTSAPDAALALLGPGEREAIQLAEELRADYLLIDERKGRLQARRRGLTVTGTLGVLLSASELGLVDVELAYRRLISQTNFRISPELDAQFSARFARSQ